MAEEIRARARACGADLVGMCALHPVMIDEGFDCRFRNVIAFGHHESYDEVLKGPEAVSDEAHRAYWMVAKIATEMAVWIREELGWDAVAHHNGGTYIQAIPVLWQCGFGELGKHGSLINPDFGASFRPSFVTTDLPVAYDAPISFGVQGPLHRLPGLQQQLSRRRHPRRLYRPHGGQAVADRCRQVLPLLPPAQGILPPVCGCLPLQCAQSPRGLPGVHDRPQEIRL
jgi:hypothetical protein